MFQLKCFLIVMFNIILMCDSSTKKLPSYIEVCKRDQATISECVRHSIETLKPRLSKGLPELDVPGIEPFYVPEIVLASGGQLPLSAVGKDVKVSGAANFSIRSLTVDLDTLTIRARVRFPHLHLVGKYTVDGQILVVPIKGMGIVTSEAVKADAELVLKGQTEKRDGVEYVRFTSLRSNIAIKDYRIRLDGLFNGDKVLGDATNEAINQNRGEFFRAVKPVLEKTVSKLFLDMANKVVDGITMDDILPLP